MESPSHRFLVITQSVRTLLCIVMFTCSVSLASGAGPYRWVDENGSVYFGDQPPAGVETRPLQGTVNGYSSERALTRNTEDTSGESSGTVTMYSASWCGVCKQARRYMKQNAISFRELDVDNNPRARKQWQRLGGKGIPVIVVNDRVMHGFSASRLDALRNR